MVARKQTVEHQDFHKTCSKKKRRVGENEEMKKKEMGHHTGRRNIDTRRSERVIRIDVHVSEQQAELPWRSIRTFILFLC